MFNLIPDTVKEKILKDYKERRIGVWLFSILIVTGSTLFFLLPTFVHVFFEEKNMQADAELVKNSLQIKKADDVVGTIKETNEQLRALSLIKNPISPVDTIRKAVEVKNAAIHVTEIEYRESPEGAGTLLLKGIALKRESLQEFVTKLQAVSGFSEVVLPVSNFAKDKDIEFAISITLL